MDLKKRFLFKKNKKPLHYSHSHCSKTWEFATNLHNREALKKLQMQLEIPSCLGYGPKSFNVQGFYAQAKINIFYQLPLVSNNFVLISYLSEIYLESWFCWLGGGVHKTLKVL